MWYTSAQTREAWQGHPNVGRDGRLPLPGELVHDTLVDPLLAGVQLGEEEALLLGAVLALVGQVAGGGGKVVDRE